MSARSEALLAEVLAQIDNLSVIEYPHRRVDSLLNNSWALEHELFSSISSVQEKRTKAVACAVDALAIALAFSEDDDGR
jgi:hypothetical protein